MKLVMMGPPGAGKGTLAIKAVSILNVPHISTGVIFRAAMSSGTSLGKEVKAIIESGRLVDDGTTVKLVQERLSQPDTSNGYILDGFPRTIAQAEALAHFSIVDKVLNINISDADAIERLGGRRVCRSCGHNFHVVFDRPKKEGVCDHCSGEVYTRNDDKVDAIQKRLEVYRLETAPLIGYYHEKGVLANMEACRDYGEALDNFKKALGL